MTQLYVIDARDLWCRVHSYVEMMSEYGFTRDLLLKSVCEVINKLNTEDNEDSKWELMHDVLWVNISLTPSLQGLDSETMDSIDAMIYEAAEVVLMYIEEKLMYLFEITRTHNLTIEYAQQNGDDVAFSLIISGLT